MKKTSGAILIMVLGMLMLMSLLVSLFLTDVMREAQLKIQLAGKDELRHYAYNTLSWVQCHLEQALSCDGRAVSLAFEEKDLHLPEYVHVEVRTEDESGKIPLNATDTRSLQAIFSQFGDAWEAKSLTSAYEQWLRRKKVNSQVIEKEMSKPGNAPAKRNVPVSNKEDDAPPQDKGATPKKINEGEPVEEAPKSQLQFPTNLNAYEQLKEIDKFRTFFFDDKGNPKEVWKRFQESTTLLSKNPVNINAATKDGIEILSKNFFLDVDHVLSYLGLDGDRSKVKHTYASLREINKLGHGRLFFNQENNEKKSKKDKEDGDKDDEDKEASPQNSQNLQRKDCRPFIQVSPHTYRVVIEVRENEVSFLLNVLFEIKIDTLTNGNIKGKMGKESGLTSAVSCVIKSLQENIL